MKRYFITGLLIWVPLVITVWVLNLLIGTLDQSLLLVPESLRPQALLGLNIPGIGAILTLLVIFLTGVLAANFIGTAPGAVLGSPAGARPGGQVDLLQRQAGERYTVFR